MKFILMTIFQGIMGRILAALLAAGAWHLFVMWVVSEFPGLKGIASKVTFVL